MAEITTIVESLKALNTKLGGSGSSASTKADVLKDIYVTLGGNASDVEEVSTVTEMIQKVTEVVSGGGGGEAPVCTLTIVNNTGDDIWYSVSPFTYKTNGELDEDENIKPDINGSGFVTPNNTYKIENGATLVVALPYYWEFDGDGQPVMMICSNADPNYTMTVSNAVNCALVEYGEGDSAWSMLEPTDATLPSSATVTISS